MLEILPQNNVHCWSFVKVLRAHAQYVEQLRDKPFTVYFIAHFIYRINKHDPIFCLDIINIDDLL